MINMAGEKRSIESPTKDTPSKKKSNIVILSPENTLINVTTPSNRPFRVSIEGNIGAGKSTMIKYFTSFSGIETYTVSTFTIANICTAQLLYLPHYLFEFISLI